jgi:two-component system, NarL family, response regulator YdfI
MKVRPTRVLVAAESDVLAATIDATLRGHDEVSVTVGPIRALARLAEEHDPDVVVLAPAATRVRAALDMVAGILHAPPVVLLADDPRAAWTAAARRAGVRAVLGGDAAADELTAAITAARVGLIALDPDVFRAPTRAGLGGSGEERALTVREREILEMIAEGLSNRAIARRLAISAYTVKFHVAAILDKLPAASRTEAVTLGVRRGLITL